MADQKKSVETATETAPAVSLSGADLIALVQSLASQNQLSAEKIVEIAAQAAAGASNRPWYDERNFPEVSVFNPLGEKANPRPELKRDVLWIGYRLQESELSKDEIDLLNQLKPGFYPQHDVYGHAVPGTEKFFSVVDMDPGQVGGRLLVMFPCKENDQRMALARYDRGRGMVDILLEMVPQARAQFAAA